jgi:flavorubredoxin
MNQDHSHIAEIADGIYRIHTPVDIVPGGFSFNQYLVVDDEPLLFHTGPRALADRVIDSVKSLISLDKLRWIGWGHVEADECGGLNALLAAAPNATPVCSMVGAMTSVNDLADRKPRPLADGDVLELGAHRVRWIDAPHVPHGWDNGYLFESSTRTLFCGDLFTQPGTGDIALTENDVLGSSEAFRQAMDYYAHTPNTRTTLERMAAMEPATLACMHGSAYRGNGAKLIGALADALTA